MLRHCTTNVCRRMASEGEIHAFLTSTMDARIWSGSNAGQSPENSPQYTSDMRLGSLWPELTWRGGGGSMSLQGREFLLVAHSQNFTILPSGLTITLLKKHRTKRSSNVRQFIRHSRINGFYLHRQYRNRTCHCRRLKLLLATKTHTFLCS